MSRKPIELRSVLYIGFDNVQGAVLMHQLPETFVTAGQFKALRPVLVPKDDLTHRVCTYYENDSQMLFLYCAECIKGANYDRGVFRYTVCFAFDADRSMGSVSPRVLWAVLKRYSAAILKAVGQLRILELKYGYLVYNHQQWQAQQGSATFGVKTPTSPVDGGALPLETLSTPLSTAPVVVAGSHQQVQLPTTIPYTNAFDGVVAQNEAWSPLDEVLDMIYRCLVGERRDVVISVSNRFHLQAMLQRTTAPVVEPFQIAIPVRPLPPSVSINSDIVTVDLFLALDNCRSIEVVAGSLGIPVNVGVEAVRHLTAAGYVHPVDPFDSVSSVFVAGYALDAIVDGGTEAKQLRTTLVRMVLHATAQATRSSTVSPTTISPTNHTLAPNDANLVPISGGRDARHEHSGLFNISPSEGRSQRGVVETDSFAVEGGSSTVAVPTVPTAALTEDECSSAAVMALLEFAPSTIEEVQAAMRAGVWCDAFDNWSDAAMRALVECALVHGWLSQVDGTVVDAGRGECPPELVDGGRLCAIAVECGVGVQFDDESGRWSSHERGKSEGSAAGAFGVLYAS